MQFSVYLFDFDGTICDTRKSLVPVFRAGYSLVGREVTEEECERWMHLNLSQSLADSGIDPALYPTVIEGIIAALDMPESLVMIEPFPEAFAVMKQLKENGAKVGIVSNNTATHIRLVLDTLRFDGELDCIVGSDMFQKGKPDPEPIETALKILETSPTKDCVYVGDSLQDVECGENAGIAGILVDREHAHPERKSISDLNDLL